MTLRIKRLGAFVANSDLVVAPPYVRPADWLTLPTVTVGEQKIVALYAVEDHPGNHVVLSVAGAYTVNWGDGLTENFATGVNANHTYDFASIPSNTTTSKGYRQVIITITMQGAANLTTFNITQKPSASPNSTFITTNWLDIEGAGSFLNSLGISGTNTSTTSRPRYLERFVWKGSNAVTTVASTFVSCGSLQSFEMNTATVTNFNAAFSDCGKLPTIPLLNTAAGTNFQNMFSGCRSLITIPHINTGNGTTFNSMFISCNSLKYVPPLDTSKGTDFASMFNLCTSLREVPSLNTGLATSMTSMFSDCRSLETVGALNTANNLTFVNTFQNCYALTTSPALNAAKVTSVANMFLNCYSLKTIGAITNSNLVTNWSAVFNNCFALETGPPLDTSGGTNFTSMFLDCRALTSVPLYNTVNATTVSTMFQGCAALRSVPAMDFTGVTSAANQNVPFANMSASKFDVRNIKWTFTVANWMLTAAELNRVYTNLATVAGQTITVSNNPGTAGDDPTIATAKGWTVTGS